MSMPADPGVTLATTLADGLEACRSLVELAAGYRALCVNLGFSEVAAEQMAVDYHRHLVARAFRDGR